MKKNNKTTWARFIKASHAHCVAAVLADDMEQAKFWAKDVRFWQARIRDVKQLETASERIAAKFGNRWA